MSKLRKIALTKRYFFLCLGSLLMILTVVTADLAIGGNYDPVECPTAKPYEGRLPLHQSPAVESLTVAGSLVGAFDTDMITRLSNALSTAMTATKAQAMSVSIARPGQASWSAIRTLDQGTSVPERFWWASVGKMFTSVAVLQLVEEGRLFLSDPIAKYVSGVPNGEVITIEHLLNHTSGLFSANEDPQSHSNPHRQTLDQELAITRHHGAMFCPGQAWRYTNTGYSLLGAVMEKVENQPYSEIITRRILDRLGSTSLRVLTVDDLAGDVAPLAPTDPSAMLVHPSWPGAAGSIVGRAEDMNRFLQALLSSTLLKPETTQRQFAHLYPMFDPGLFYGLGIMLYEPPGSGIYWLGHSGGTPGAKAISVWSPKDRAIISVALTGDGSAEATASLLLRTLSEP